MTEATMSEKIENTMDILGKRTSLRKFVKEENLSVDQIDRIMRRLSLIRDEVEEAENKAEEARKEHQKKLEEAKKKLEDSGINISELVEYERGNGTVAKRKTGTRSARSNPDCLYRYEDENGKKKEVVLGKLGRPTDEMSEYLKRHGLKKKDCLVKELSEQESASASGGKSKSSSKKTEKQAETA